ncbi:GNAT family N-acetyltransferase [Aurantimonas sp. VKM B-3413]|uniref:GNAT family N-acetyltransferase n=1 Tax=Aurantimonas sp. VKM B-3413 TaxID=2779401 RepID=UPI001E5DBAD1|nr:GNAT family N-acetyltransferase [Aurantimonas sp. VKM B-3413]MCB8840435.1 GNAT family N-acetyltransferase [Aurantimonas sp. VKM B-3413]
MWNNSNGSDSGQASFAIRIVERIAAVDPNVWNGLAATGGAVQPHPENPFVTHEFLSALEDSGCVGQRAGWLPQHLVLEGDDGVPIAVAPAYLKSHSQGEYVFDYGWADAFQRAGGRYYPKLQMSVPFTPATGPRLLVGGLPGAEVRRQALAEGAKAYVAKTGVSSVHATFVTEDDLTALTGSDWLHRTDQQFHFRNRGYGSYDDFLATLASRKRKALKKERREALANDISIEWLTGRDLTEAAWDAFFEFYLDTGGRKWGRPYLNRRFFSLIGERMGDRVLLIMAKRAGRYIAGALNLLGTDTIFGRNWGCIEEHPFLHFEVCYHQAIDYAIAHKLEVVEAGAQGQHKLARGYEPVTTHSAHFIAHPGLRHAIEDYLEAEREEVEQVGEILSGHTPYKKGDAE